jgi:hypothetical protein
MLTIDVLLLDYQDATLPIKTHTYSHTANVNFIEITYLKIYPLVLINSFPPPSRQRFWNSGSLEEWKLCHYVMFDAGIHLRLLSTSILGMHKVFEVLLCCLKGIWVHPYTVTQSKLSPDFGFCGHLWSGNVAISSYLRLTSTSECFPHPY